jgi:hypothetical protein
MPHSYVESGVGRLAAQKVGDRQHAEAQGHEDKEEDEDGQVTQNEIFSQDATSMAKRCL